MTMSFNPDLARTMSTDRARRLSPELVGERRSTDARSRRARRTWGR